MFYLNSADTSLIPDSLFFLQKIGLLKYRVAEDLTEDSLYFIENNVTHKIYTLDTISDIRGTQNTVLVFDFLLGTYKSLFQDQNVIVVPHVYFDYVTTIKNLAEFKEFSSFKIYSPETSNALIPKKHLKITLPFLKDNNFIAHIGKLVDGPQKTASNFSLLGFTGWALKIALSALVVFCLKPFVQTKLFFAKYNFRYIIGQTRLMMIKMFYLFFNLRFEIKRFFFRLKQSGYVFYTFFRYTAIYHLGTFRIALIRISYFIANLRFPLWRNLSAFYWINYKYTFYPFRKLSWIIEHEFNKRILKTHDASKH